MEAFSLEPHLFAKFFCYALPCEIGGDPKSETRYLFNLTSVFDEFRCIYIYIYIYNNKELCAPHRFMWDRPVVSQGKNH